MALTPALKKQADLALVLETQQAEELQKVMKATSAELDRELKSLAANGRLNKVNLNKAVRQLSADLEQNLRAATNAEEQLLSGVQSGRELVGNSASIPSSSAFFDTVPVLPLEALSLGNSVYADSIKSVTKEFKQKALEQVKVGIAKGESAFEMQKRLVGAGLRGSLGRDGVFRRPAWRAEMIARTTSNDLVNRGRQIAYEEIDSEFPELQLEKQWVTVGDRRTSNRCRSLSNQIRPLNENYQASDGWTGSLPPAHVNCRSMSVSSSKKWSEDSELKAAKKVSQGNKKVAKRAAKSVNLSPPLPSSKLTGRSSVPGLPTGDHWDPKSSAGKKLRKAQAQDDLFRSISDADGNLQAFVKIGGNTVRTEIGEIVTEAAFDGISEAELRVLNGVAKSHANRFNSSGGIRWKAPKSKREDAEKLGFVVRKETAKTVELQLDDWQTLANLYDDESAIGLSAEAFARARGTHTLSDFVDEGARVAAQFDAQIKKLQGPLKKLRKADEVAVTIQEEVRTKARNKFPEYNQLVKERNEFVKRVATLSDKELEALIPEYNELVGRLSSKAKEVRSFMTKELKNRPEFVSATKESDKISAQLDKFKDDLLAAVVPNQGHDVAVSGIKGVTDEIAEQLDEIAAVTRGDGVRLVRRIEENTGRASWNGARGVLSYNGQNRSVLWHEIGHAVEGDRSDVSAASKQWILNRRTSDVSVPLGGPYGPEEVAFPGNFHDPYAGRDYAGPGTEILSLGLQEFAAGETLLDLINADRELFEYVIGVLR